MMKRLILFMGILLPFFAVSQTKQKVKVIEIKKLVIDKQKSYKFDSKDSSVSIFIDTLIMHPNAKINFYNKKDASMVVRHAEIAKGAMISGSDSKNNGTDLKLSINFKSLGNLLINVPGLDAKNANRKFANGDGGEVVINYLSSGIKPQTVNSKQESYIEIRNGAGGYRTNAQTELPVIMDQIRTGSPGRPLGQLPQGRVFSGGIGREGKITVEAVESL